MDEVTTRQRLMPPFNGPVEIGLRALTVLNAAYPDAYSLQRLVAFDYLIVHSDDIPNGPSSLHPRTPYRGGELMVRRGVLQSGLRLYQSRGLIERRYNATGLYFSATEFSAAFLDAITTSYVEDLRDRAAWMVATFQGSSDEALEVFIRQHAGEWGAELTMESVLWEEGPQ